HRRHEIQDLEDLATSRDGQQQTRDDEPPSDLEDEGDRKVAEMVEERSPEHRVAEQHVRVVLQPDEAHRGDAVQAEEAEEDGLEDGQEEAAAEEGGRWEEEDEYRQSCAMRKHVVAFPCYRL